MSAIAGVRHRCPRGLSATAELALFRAVLLAAAAHATTTLAWPAALAQTGSGQPIVPQRAPCEQISFPVSFEVSTGDAPSSIAMGDVDGDGDQDLVTGHAFSDDLRVHSNHGDGTFSGETSYSSGNEPLSVALGDLDGDGDLDVVAGESWDHIAVRPNLGGGVLGPHVSYTTGVLPLCLAIHDMDDDGDLDVVTANRRHHGTGGISVLLNVGDGTFEPERRTVLGDWPNSIDVGDLDLDGDADVVVAPTPGDVTVLLNQGDATFAAPVSYSVARRPRSGRRPRHLGLRAGQGHLGSAERRHRELSRGRLVRKPEQRAGRRVA